MNRDSKITKMMTLSPVTIVLLALLIFTQVGAAAEMLKGDVHVLQQVNPTDWRIGIRAGSMTITRVYTNVTAGCIANLQYASNNKYEVIMEIYHHPNNGCWYVNWVEVCDNPLPGGGFGAKSGIDECIYENTVPLP